MRYRAITCMLTVHLAAGTAYAGAESAVSDELYTAWKVLRQLDCARCHGPTFEGSVGPSLVKSAADRPEAEFTQLLLDGNIERGMPAYRDVEPVASNAHAIYAYFKARADGSVDAGKLSPPGETETEDSAEDEGETSAD